MSEVLRRYRPALEYWTSFEEDELTGQEIKATPYGINKQSRGLRLLLEKLDLSLPVLTLADLRKAAAELLSGRELDEIAAERGASPEAFAALLAFWCRDGHGAMPADEERLDRWARHQATRLEVDVGEWRRDSLFYAVMTVGQDNKSVQLQAYLQEKLESVFGELVVRKMAEREVPSPKVALQVFDAVSGLRDVGLDRQAIEPFEGLRQMLDGENTSSRDNGSGRSRPRGYAPWSPRAKTEAVLEQVNNVLEEYQDHLPLTIRQVFYRLVAQHGFDKTEKAYKKLGEILNRGRRAKYVPFDAIRDDGIVTQNLDVYGSPEDFWDATGQSAREYRRDLLNGQRVRLEVWCEAAGMLGQLARVAHEYAVPVFSAGGFVSLTGVRLVADRALELSVPLVILHVGDLDPSGESIFHSLTEDARAFVLDDRVIQTQDVLGRRVALTREQVELWQLPTAPPKPTDTRTKRFDGETCQLEALSPDTLAGLVRQAIEEELDLDRLRAQRDLEREDRVELLAALPEGRGE